MWSLGAAETGVGSLVSVAAGDYGTVLRLLTWAARVPRCPLLSTVCSLSRLRCVRDQRTLWMGGGGDRFSTTSCDERNKAVIQEYDPHESHKTSEAKIS